MDQALAAATALPPDHPQRRELNDEVHARPSEPLAAPASISYLALLGEAAGDREAEWQAVHDLALRFGVPPPLPGAIHYSADFGPFRLKWERHTEFSRCMFVVPGHAEEVVDGQPDDDPFAAPAIAAVPADWVAALPGRLIVAVHAVLLARQDAPPDPVELVARAFGGNPAIGATVGAGAATALTDFRIREDGFGRMVVLDRGMAPRQAGRMVQRLLEIDTYRILALLALPLARELTPFLTRCEAELAEITTALVTAGEPDEPLLLARLTRLAAEIESRESASRYRFSAAAAYYELVRRRIAELREARIEGMPTLQEFTERRLAPAMNTCRAVAARQESLSQRVARATQLLSTRVDLTRERQNQALLEQMNRRAQVQLRLQQTVEGLSVAAITYYIVGLVGYAAKGVRAAGLRFDPDVAMGVSIPVVALLVGLGLRHTRRTLLRRGD